MLKKLNILEAVTLLLTLLLVVVLLQNNKKVLSSFELEENVLFKTHELIYNLHSSQKSLHELVFSLRVVDPEKEIFQHYRAAADFPKNIRELLGWSSAYVLEEAEPSYQLLATLEIGNLDALSREVLSSQDKIKAYNTKFLPAYENVINIIEAHERAITSRLGEHNKNFFSLNRLFIISLSTLIFLSLVIAFNFARKYSREAEKVTEQDTAYKAIFEKAVDGILIFDDGGTVVAANSAMGDLLGYEPGELLGLDINALFKPQSPTTLEETNRELFNKISIGLDVTGIRKNDTEVPMEMSISRQRIGDVLQYTAMIRDRTTRFMAEKMLRESKQAVEESNRIKSEFLATMSHEVKTPMNGVIGTLNLLEDAPLSGEYRVYLDTAIRSSEAMMTLLDSILAYSKMESGRMELEELPFDLRQLARDVVTNLQVQLNPDKISCESVIDDNLPELLMMDPLRMRQVLSNLADNARKFTPKGKITLQIKAENVRADSVRVMFSIIDTGVGISADEMERIFKPFTQADSTTTRRYGGTGLGLSICKWIVEQMGGSIEVKSEKNQGTTFSFALNFRLPDENSKQLVG